MSADLSDLACHVCKTGEDYPGTTLRLTCATCYEGFVTRVRKVLRSVEWVVSAEESYAPSCWHCTGTKADHRAGCALAMLLAECERELATEPT
jgi:hypothetical protein